MTRFGQRNVTEVTCHLWQGVSRTSAKFATHSLLPACMAVKASVTVGSLSVWVLERRWLPEVPNQLTLGGASEQWALLNKSLKFRVSCYYGIIETALSPVFLYDNKAKNWPKSFHFRKRHKLVLALCNYETKETICLHAANDVSIWK